MKWNLGLFLTLAIFLSTCTENIQPPASLTGSWLLYAFEDVTTQIQDHEPSHVPRSIVLEFSDKGKKGTFSGKTVTNEIIGAYTLQENNIMFIRELSGTLFGEPEWGDKFWAAIRDIHSFKREGSQLYLYYEGGAKRMIWNSAE